jgi:hypothetical protein
MHSRLDISSARLLYTYYIVFEIVIVPDRRSQVLEVVIVRHFFLGFWEFGRGRDWEGVEKGKVSLETT